MVAPVDWMRDCPACVGLINAFLEVKERDELPIKELVETQEHLLAEHSDRIPGYVEGCSNCEEWKWTAAHPESVRPAGLLPLLERENWLHRAGHLLYPSTG